MALWIVTAAFYYIYCEQKRRRLSQQGCQMVNLQNQKSRFGYILEGREMENVLTYIYGYFDYFTAPLVYFIANLVILWSFGIFTPFWFKYCAPKNLATLSHRVEQSRKTGMKS
jgi:hypothetical protein